jgi:hypothetical protein
MSVLFTSFHHFDKMLINEIIIFTGGGGRSAIQLVNGTDHVTAAGGGGGADCDLAFECGGGGKQLP